MKVKVSDIGEKALISYILDKNPSITPDDAGIINLPHTNLTATTDMLIDSTHFPPNMSHYQMGFKSVTVNVSDLAAMAAEPVGFLLSLAIPHDLYFDSFKEIIRGVGDACRHYSIPLIGGDLNEASEIIITGTALGVCKKALMKDTYREGDLICLTGKIGLAALGFNLEGDNIYTQKALKPYARLKEGLCLKNLATSATDITDGLASELYTIKKEGCGFMIYEDKLAISDEFLEISQKLALNYLDLVLHVGEDFELLFTIDKNDLDKIDFEYLIIGEVNSTGKVELTLENSEVVEIENKGYEHLC